MFTPILAIFCCLQECVRTFADMNREENVYSYYYRCHTAAAHRKWQQLCQSDSDTLPVTLKVRGTPPPLACAVDVCCGYVL